MESKTTVHQPHARRYAVFGAALFALFSVSSFAQYALKSRRDFRVGDHPVQVLAADYDGDGQIDLISIDENSNSISLLKGFGDGTFRVVGNVVAGTKPKGAVFVDVNHDGKPDLVTANFLTQDVTVNLGNGMGGFGAGISSPAGGTNFGLAVGDWNNDTHLDVALVNTTANTVTLMRGTGTGTFNNRTVLTVGTYPTWVDAADFNADGKLDLAVVNRDSASVQIWRGDGLGGFTLNLTLSTGSATGPVFVRARDLNGDNRPDLAVCLNYTNQVKVYLANTTGGFNTPSTLSPGNGPLTVEAADINRDGFIDLLVGQSLVSGVGEIAVMAGNGAGVFAAPTILSSGPYPGSLVAADFNNDGNVDVAAASLTGRTISVLQTTATGAFIVADRINLTSGAYPTGVVVADFNRDGKLDVASTNEGTDNLAFAFGTGSGTFQSPTYVSTGNLSAPQALAVIDTNRDSAPDLVAVTDLNTMSVLQNNGSGSMNATNGLAIGVCDTPEAIASGEISGDLNPDIAFVCSLSYHVCTRRGTGGTGSSAFGATVCTFIDPVPEGIGIGYFNFDSLKDMAMSSNSSNWVGVGFSDGFGGLQDLPSAFPTGMGPMRVAVGDLNNDGYDDIVVANSLSATVSSLIGDGGGVFTFPSIESPAGEAPTAVALADFNLDGKLDIAAVNSNSNTVSLLLGDGFGYFNKAGDFGTRDQPDSIAAGDFNQDGKPDLVVADHFTDTLTILLNQNTLTDPLQSAMIFGAASTVFRWGLVPGALYDVIRGDVGSVTQMTSTFNLGPVTCLANDIPDTDTAAVADATNPPLGKAYFYMVRSVISGVAGQYSVSTNGKRGVPASGGCN
jgi:hypothetical protein